MEQSTITYLGDGGLSGPITADSTPEFDIPFYPFDDGWSCADWMVWHQRLKEKYGLEEANSRFLQGWQDQGRWGGNSFCRYNDEFVSYFEAQGLKPGNLISTVVTNASDTIENVSKGAKSISAGLPTLSINKILLVAGLAGGAYLLSPFLPIVKSKIKDWTKQ